MEKTLKNLSLAFVGESQARNRYTFYAKVAKKEGYEQVAAIFMETAEQEKTHAKRIFEHLQELKGGDASKEVAIKIEVEVPNVYGNTLENLQAAISGETHEYEVMYPEFADVAEAEGLETVAARFRAIAKAEKHHKERYQKLLEQIEAGTVFKKEQATVWICRECGYSHTGPEAPKICPSCDHPQAYYQLECENY